MARLILMDEFHLSILVPPNLAPAPFRAIRRTLGNAGFHAALRRAVRLAVGQFPSLSPVRVRLSR